VAKPQSMLLVLGLPFRREGDRLLCESQAVNGLQRWGDNFESVILAAPVMPTDLPQDWQNQGIWIDVATLDPQQFEFVPLPWAYALPDFLRHYASTRSQLADLVKRCSYLQFGLEWLIGDWAAIAAIEAAKQGKAYAIHKDIVSHKMLLQTATSFKSRLLARFKAPLIQAYHHWIIRHADLGLWHGADCYAAYSSLCPNSYLIHDIHTKPSDLITTAALAVKQDSTLTGVLRICYVGRMAAMKAPLQWVQTMARLKELGVEFTATWVGDGEQRAETEAAIATLGLTSYIQVLGFESDRQRVLQHFREAHVLVFTHVTPESPRCLIEALISGTPILGYESAYAKDIVKTNPLAGSFVSVGNWQQLAEVIRSVDRDRPTLAQRTLAAAACGQHFSDEAVFLERSRLIKHHLTPSTSIQDASIPPRSTQEIDLDRTTIIPDSVLDSTFSDRNPSSISK
jgi:glycosyltransferase involved in cell wall biosynthesis